MTDFIKTVTRPDHLKAVFAAGAVALAMGVALAGTALAQTGAQKALIDAAKSRGEMSVSSTLPLGFARRGGRAG